MHSTSTSKSWKLTQIFLSIDESNYQVVLCHYFNDYREDFGNSVVNAPDDTSEKYLLPDDLRDVHGPLVNELVHSKGYL